MIEQSFSDELTIEQLTEDQIAKVFKTCRDGFDNGKRARQDKEEIWARCWQAFTMYKDKRLFAKQPWRTQIVVSWVYDTVESAIDDLSESLFPNEEDFFSVQPAIQGDELQERNAEGMTRFLQNKLTEADFISTFRLFLKQLAITGSSVLKCYWKKDERVMSETVFMPDGSSQRVRSLVTDYDAPYAEVILMQDFVMYPALGDVNKALCVQRIIRPLDQVKNNPAYLNTEDLRGDVKNETQVEDRQLSQRINTALGIKDDVGDNGDFVELLEAWGDFVIDGVRYMNYVATVARNQNKVLRFQPNPHDHGMKPFVFCGWRDVPGHVYAVGLVEPVLDYQAMGSTISNMIFDEAKLKIHGQYKYVPDGVFDPDAFEARPGAAHPVGEIDNLQAINPNLNLSFGFSERNNLKGEMEETTGVTQFSKGAESAGKSRTARESVLLAQAGTKKATVIAKHVSRKALVPTLQRFYMLVRQFEDPLKIVEETGLQLPELAQLMPLGKTQFRITGLTTTLQKQAVIENFRDFVTAVLPTPASMMINWGEVVDGYYKAIGFRETENLLLPKPLRDVMQQMLIAQQIGMLPPPEMLSAQLNGTPMPGQAPGGPPEQEGVPQESGTPPPDSGSMIGGII